MTIIPAKPFCFQQSGHPLMDAIYSSQPMWFLIARPSPYRCPLFWPTYVVANSLTIPSQILFILANPFGCQ